MFYIPDTFFFFLRINKTFSVQLHIYHFLFHLYFFIFIFFTYIIMAQLINNNLYEEPVSQSYNEKVNLTFFLFYNNWAYTDSLLFNIVQTSL